MKSLIILTAFTAILSAQPVQKPAPEKPATSTAPADRALSDDEVLKLSLANSQIEVLRSKYDIVALEKKYKEFQAEVAQIAARQEVIVKAACASVGVSEADIKTGGCGLSLGLDTTGKAINGQDGKPIVSRVWREVKKPQMAALPTVEKPNK